MPKQKIFIITIAVLFVISLALTICNCTPEEGTYDKYSSALEKYNSEDFKGAYHQFGRVSRFSRLKPAAIYRQALCVDKLDDFKTEEGKYTTLARFYPNTKLAVRAKYLRAKMNYDGENYRRVLFRSKDVYRHYPNTDYGIAAQYYMGIIKLEKIKNIKNPKKALKIKKQARECFKNYLHDASNGKFALASIKGWTSLGLKLNNEDNLLIAQVYQDNQRYLDAEKYLKYTDISISWPYLAQNAYLMKNNTKLRLYTEAGIRGKGSNEVLINENIDEQTENENIYKAIDLYLKTSPNPKESISYLLSVSNKKSGYDYLLYKNCTNLPVVQQTACFNTLYYKYPDGQFAAESLSKLFYERIKQHKYDMAKQIGRKHLIQFKNVKSTPKIIFWLAKLSEKTKNYDEERSYYKRLLREYPDDYYAYQAFLNLNRFKYFDKVILKNRPVLFPYNDIKSNEFITDLLRVKDYGLINLLYDDDEFIRSWLFYKQGNYSASATIARDAMEKLKPKPDRSDLRWRLVYPIHYLPEIQQNSMARGNDSILMLSIIREESYFNPYAKSPVGAVGLMQLMPATASEAARKAGLPSPNVKSLMDVNTNIRLGNIYYSTLKQHLDGKDVLAVLSYNGGMGAVLRWKNRLNYEDVDDFIEQIPYPETQNYLKKVYKSYWNYLRIYDGVKF